MQRQYAAQLQQDQANKRQETPDMPGGGGLQVGGYESAMAQQKADMQRQYAAQLQQDQANKRQDTPDMPGGGGLAGIGGYQEDKRDHKRDRQGEYAKLLQRDQQLKVQADLDQKERGGVYGNINAIGGQPADKKSSQAAYAAQLKAQQALAQELSPIPAVQFEDKVQRAGSAGTRDAFSGLGNFEENEKLLKRKKQEEYSQALKEQQLLHQQREAEAMLKQPKEAFHSEASRGGALAAQGAEWTLGPLGVPVRKVLEVGDRGKQKHFCKTNRTKIACSRCSFRQICTRCP